MRMQAGIWVWVQVGAMETYPYLGRWRDHQESQTGQLKARLAHLFEAQHSAIF